MIVGIVGAEAAKFTEETEHKARLIIRLLLTHPKVTGLTSGGCHLGGIDIWAEEEADRLGIEKIIHTPRCLSWTIGYAPRNRAIARTCTELHNITVREYPPSFTGRRFKVCYHCTKQDHVKSGGCWTRNYAKMLGKPVKQWII